MANVDPPENPHFAPSRSTTAHKAQPQIGQNPKIHIFRSTHQQSFQLGNPRQRIYVTTIYCIIVYLISPQVQAISYLKAGSG